MAKSVICKLPHLFGKKLKISTEIYDIGHDGVCADMKDHHADELLRLPVWDLDEAAPAETPAKFPLESLHPPSPQKQPPMGAELQADPEFELEPENKASPSPGPNPYRKQRKGKA